MDDNNRDIKVAEADKAAAKAEEKSGESLGQAADANKVAADAHEEKAAEENGKSAM